MTSGFIISKAGLIDYYCGCKEGNVSGIIFEAHELFNQMENPCAENKKILRVLSLLASPA